jgi:hypothetical protein
MPAEYLSRLPGTKENITSVSAFDPFQVDLYKLQMQDKILQGTPTNGLQRFQNKTRLTTRP